METHRSKRARVSKSPPKAVETEPLPLDWTRVKRRRPGTNGDDGPCDLPDVVQFDETALTEQQELVQGLGVICMHDSDSTWFQGYFFPNQKEGMGTLGDIASLKQDCRQKPWGLLAVQDELDECLQCVDGGYRRISLTVCRFPSRRKERLPNVEVTGGDMMRFEGETVLYEPHKLTTGPQAVPMVEDLFSDLLQKCRGKLQCYERHQEYSNGGDTAEVSLEVLDMMPDVTVITGPMKLVLPKPEEDDEDDFLGL